MGWSEENVGNLETLAAKRKERLMKLKKQQAKLVIDTDEQTHQLEELPTSQVLFRNYQPSTVKLEHAKLPTIEAGDVETLINEQLKHAQTQEQITEVEMHSLAPKKLTYDLQRGIQLKLDKLEKRTDRAIAEIIRERLKGGKQLDIIFSAKLQKRETYGSDED